jgi:hypothetical protein
MCTPTRFIMTYKEKLMQLHKAALQKLKEITEYETALEADDSICENVCDADWYAVRLQKYEDLQAALNERDHLAKKINEEQLDINLEYKS